MQQLKAILATLTLGGLAIFMFFIGLGLTIFTFIGLAIASVFMKPAARETLKKRWATKTQKNTQSHNETIIEGQYTVVENH